MCPQLNQGLSEAVAFRVSRGNAALLPFYVWKLLKIETSGVSFCSLETESEQDYYVALLESGGLHLTIDNLAREKVRSKDITLPVSIGSRDYDVCCRRIEWRSPWVRLG